MLTQQFAVLLAAFIFLKKFFLPGQLFSLPEQRLERLLPVLIWWPLQFLPLILPKRIWQRLVFRQRLAWQRQLVFRRLAWQLAWWQLRSLFWPEVASARLRPWWRVSQRW